VTTVRPGDNDQLLVSSRATSRKRHRQQGQGQDRLPAAGAQGAMTDLPDYVISGDGSFVGIENLGAYHSVSRPRS